MIIVTKCLFGWKKRELHTSNWGSLHPKLIHPYGCVYIYWGNLRRVIRVPSILDPFIPHGCVSTIEGTSNQVIRVPSTLNRSILHGWVFIIEKRGHLHLWNECQVLIHFMVLYPNWDTPFEFWLGIFNNLCHYGLCSCLLYYYTQACINDLFFMLCFIMMAKKNKNKQTNKPKVHILGFITPPTFLILYYYFNGYVHFQSWISSSKLKSPSSWDSWPPCTRLWLILFFLIFNARWYNSLVR